MKYKSYRTFGYIIEFTVSSGDVWYVYDDIQGTQNIHRADVFDSHEEAVKVINKIKRKSPNFNGVVETVSVTRTISK